MPDDDDAALWTAATRHPFLDGVRDGSLPVDALDTWLAQDALFVADLPAFQARLLARSPRSDQAVLAGGAVDLVEELDWFERLAYRALLRLDAAPYADALGCLEVVERVHLEAWRWALSGAAAHAELVEHWTTPGFAAYVDGLASASGRAGPPDPGLVADVLRQEAASWSMALPHGAVTP